MSRRFLASLYIGSGTIGFMLIILGLRKMGVLYHVIAVTLTIISLTVGLYLQKEEDEE